ncbi:tRNA (N(6)-L-threonylcarbamoyladenosine(37)-C(2))-methylthiotransferase MtaB, partial [Nguyenibacter vanlangensis]|nr:tRNA (N(6)-L-threonylcarbamoyladenosine(37)-C(2))-methylthiotransferase MtaB [Nguyenibacter vanlangensis]
ELRAAGQEAARDYHARLLGRPLNVLLETPTSGHSEEFAPVRLVGAAADMGRIVTVRPTAVDENGLVAETL